MTKRRKITIITAALALAIAAAAVFFIFPRKSSSGSETPSRISVYDNAAGVIYTPSYEDFLAGCVAGLTPNNSELDPEAMRAVAIAENTRIKYFLANKSGFGGIGDLGADLTVSEYLPYSPEKVNERVKKAAKEAANASLSFNGEPFIAPICRISAGRTEALPPYSPSIGLPCDVDAPGCNGSSSFTPEAVREALGGGNLSYNFAEWFRDPVYTENGTLRYIEFSGERITGDTLKKKLGLRSTAISVDFREDLFYFTTKGWGDNKGMSVNAANYLAKKGKTAEEILAIFYPEAVIN
ncbi:MAG: hypothetical protein K2J77_09570 [Oscillospiraceae bacterium]|nr:hypothetical protein [Oscillospiraceae bacterium]